MRQLAVINNHLRMRAEISKVIAVKGLDNVLKL